MELKQLGSNMTQLNVNGTEVLFSYETPVASYHPATGLKKTSKKWSVTTSRHINKWIIARGYDPSDVSTASQDYFYGLLSTEPCCGNLGESCHGL